MKLKQKYLKNKQTKTKQNKQNKTLTHNSKYMIINIIFHKFKLTKWYTALSNLYGACKEVNHQLQF